MGDLFERAQRSAPMPTPTPIDDEQRSVCTITAKTGLALDDLPLCQAGPVSAPAPIGAGPYRLAGLRSAELDDEPLIGDLSRSPKLSWFPISNTSCQKACRTFGARLDTNRPPRPEFERREEYSES
jgi:hypothetical protein